MTTSLDSHRSGNAAAARLRADPQRDPSPLLRTLLGIDAATCLAFGVALVGASAPVARATGLSAALLLEAGGVLVAFGAFVAWAATRRPIPRLAVLAIVDVNGLWAVAGVALACLDDAATPLGRVLVASQGIAVGVLGIVEWLVARRDGTRSAGRRAMA